MKGLRLKDVCTKIGSGATPRGGGEVYVARGVALIRSQNIYNDGFHEDGLAFIGPGHAEELSSVEVAEDDVLLNITGDSVARACLAPALVLPARVNQHVTIIRPDPARLDPRYLHYHLVSPTKQDEMLALASAGATRDALTKGMIEAFEVPDPGIVTQRRIANVLQALDNKIEHNRRTCRALERLARAIFKAWFVDFEPVKAKAAGARSFPSMPQPAFDALPDRFTDSELGQVPTGWEVSSFGSFGEITIGGDWGDDAAFEGGTQAACLRGVDLEHFRKTGEATPPLRWFKPQSLERRKMNPCDVLVAGSGAGPTGRPLWMSPRLLATLPNAVYSNFCKRIRCRSQAHAIFLDAHLHEMRESGTIWDFINGTSVPNLDGASLMTGKFVALPPESLLAEYEQIVLPIWERHYAGENQALATLRDYLLPKLLSGEVRVEAAHA